MTELHPDLAALRRFDPNDVTGTIDAFAEDAVFHDFNPQLPELQGDHVGRADIESFFASIGAVSGGSFRVEPVSASPVGDELVVVWRNVDGLIAEVWDIPAVHTVWTAGA